jgi:peptide/nickel transport system permease protein
VCPAFEDGTGNTNVPIPLYILKRLLISIPTILIVSMLGFLLMRFDFTLGPIEIPVGGDQVIQVMEKVRIKNPIDPLANLKGNPAITEAAYQHEKERLGLDKPLYEQYWLWLSHVLQFHPEKLLEGKPQEFFTPDLGKTFKGEDVAGLLISRAGNTLLLNIVSLALTWLIAIPVGVYAALRWRSVLDRLMAVFSAVGMAFPGFVLALLLAIWAVKTGIFPLGGIVSDNFSSMSPLEQVGDILRHIAIPVMVITFGGIAGLQRQMRGNLLDVLGAEYVRTARAKGLPENVVIYKHAIRTAINPLVTMLGFEFAALLGGSILLETVLGFPGIGLLTYQAVQQTDTNLVMATLVMSAVMLVIGNLLADILLKIVDPRIELA